MRRTFATFTLCPSGAIGGCAGILTPPVSRTNTIHEHLGIEGVLAEYSAILVLFQVYQASSLSLGHMNIQAFRDSIVQMSNSQGHVSHKILHIIADGMDEPPTTHSTTVMLYWLQIWPQSVDMWVS